jgi:hypothetical protein
MAVAWRWVVAIVIAVHAELGDIHLSKRGDRGGLEVAERDHRIGAVQRHELPRLDRWWFVGEGEQAHHATSLRREAAARASFGLVASRPGPNVRPRPRRSAVERRLVPRVE